MHFYDPLLYPFAFLYQAATGFRNKLFDIGTKKSTAFTVPVVVVGNLSMGGTGKTPMVEFLIRTFQKQANLGVISRGYRRKSNGFVLADKSTKVEELGDESFQIYQKYGDRVSVAVGEARALAIPMLLAERPSTDLILLDDAFQHRYVAGDCSILLTTYQKPFFRDRILPLGTLRERASGAQRADVIVVTKRPTGMSELEKDEYRSQIRKYCRKDIPILFSGIKYGAPVPVVPNGKQMKESVVVVTGIASNEAMLGWVNQRYKVLEVLSFPDHHRYSVLDVEKIVAVCRKFDSDQPGIITTEKDAVKLKADFFLPYWSEIPIFALPIAVDLSREDEEVIKKMVQQVVKEKKYSREE
ncbi:MAG TPA: tetraacyldisaccharide 4'-kinase [Lunatimonas sp.]|nr:tetraacyldisaccharide 4'-kinase [Lunatimonas sp.]